MSGVCGLVRFDGGVVTSADIDRQMKAMARRGPDRARSWLDGAVGLGALLMRVTHEDDADAQPIRDRDRDLTFVSDARLDNREEIAALLGMGPAGLARTPDSALIFEAFKAWGGDCVERLMGDFLFAVWDGDARTLTLARDHMGQRHAFYHLGEDFFAFASERKGLWALADVPRVLPARRIVHVLAERTVVRGAAFDACNAEDELKAIPGGTVMTIRADGQVSSRRYWTPRAAPEHEGRDEAYYIDAYRRVLGEAVACRVRRLNRPASLMLAGGFDSSAIAGLAGAALEHTGHKLICVSSVMPKDAPPTPRDARQWVEACQRHMPHLDVHCITEPDLGLLDKLEAGFLAMDNSNSENRFVTDPVIRAAAQAGARVMMDGNGGDYTLNPRDKGWFLDQLRARRFGLFLREWRARRRVLKVGHFTLFRGALLLHAAPWLVRRWRRWRNGLDAMGASMPISPEIRAAAEPERLSFAMGRPQREKMMRALRRQQDGPTVGYATPAAMHGLEFTQPFHDKRVVELALAIPDWMFMKDGRERPLARAALKDIYPPEFADRDDLNDALGPDFVSTVLKLRPKVLADIDRMEASGRLAAYFDFAKMRRMLTRPLRGGDGRPAENACRRALRAYVWGRYIEWFTGGNA